MTTTTTKVPQASAQTVDRMRQLTRNSWRYDLEDVVIGSVLLERHAYSEVADILKPQTFIGERGYIPNSEVWRSIQEVALQGVVDIITVTRHLMLRFCDLPKNPYAEYKGVAYQVSKYTDRVASSANVQYYSMLLFEFALREQAVAILRQHEAGELGELTEIIGYLSDETRDILQDVELAGAFLKGYGYTELAEQMDEYCAKVAVRLRAMSKQAYQRHIIDQFHTIMYEDPSSEIKEYCAQQEQSFRGTLEYNRHIIQQYQNITKP